MAKYWFRRRSPGYGAAPNSWQGWVLTLAMLALVLGLVFLGPAIRDDASRALWMTLGIALVLVPFCLIARLKTEGGWRWRSGRD